MSSKVEEILALIAEIQAAIESRLKDKDKEIETLRQESGVQYDAIIAALKALLEVVKGETTEESTTESS